MGANGRLCLPQDRGRLLSPLARGQEVLDAEARGEQPWPLRRPRAVGLCWRPKGLWRRHAQPIGSHVPFRAPTVTAAASAGALGACRQGLEHSARWSLRHRVCPPSSLLQPAPKPTRQGAAGTDQPPAPTLHAWAAAPAPPGRTCSAGRPAAPGLSPRTRLSASPATQSAGQAAAEGRPARVPTARGHRGKGRAVPAARASRQRSARPSEGIASS